MPPPDDYEARAKHFITAQGRIRSRAEVRREVAKITDHVKSEAKGYAAELAKGTLTPAQLEVKMRELLKSAHIIAATVGRGGRERMTPRDWGKVGNKIAWQNKYLKKFVRLIAKDILSGPASSNRIQLYASAIHTTFYKAFAEEMRDTGQQPGDIPLDANGKELLVRLVQNSKEGCEDCNADAEQGFMPLDELQDLGSRSCGDFCLCVIIFSDEVNE